MQNRLEDLESVWNCVPAVGPALLSHPSCRELIPSLRLLNKSWSNTVTQSIKSVEASLMFPVDASQIAAKLCKTPFNIESLKLIYELDLFTDCQDFGEGHDLPLILKSVSHLRELVVDPSMIHNEDWSQVPVLSSLTKLEIPMGKNIELLKRCPHLVELKITLTGACLSKSVLEELKHLKLLHISSHTSRFLSGFCEEESFVTSKEIVSRGPSITDLQIKSMRIRPGLECTPICCLIKSQRYLKKLNLVMGFQKRKLLDISTILDAFPPSLEELDIDNIFFAWVKVSEGYKIFYPSSVYIHGGCTDENYATYTTFNWIENLPSLTSLKLWTLGLSDGSFWRLQSLKNLQRLVVRAPSISCKDLTEISWIKSLRTLEICGATVDEDKEHKIPYDRLLANGVKLKCID